MNGLISAVFSNNLLTAFFKVLTSAFPFSLSKVLSGMSTKAFHFSSFSSLVVLSFSISTAAVAVSSKVCSQSKIIMFRSYLTRQKISCPGL